MNEFIRLTLGPLFREAVTGGNAPVNSDSKLSESTPVKQECD